MMNDTTNCSNLLLQEGGPDPHLRGAQLDQGGHLDQGGQTDQGGLGCDHGHGNNGRAGKGKEHENETPLVERECEQVCEIAKLLEVWSD